MAKRSKQYSFHLNLNNPDHLKIYRTLEDLNTDIHKSVSNFVIKAIIQYINGASKPSLTKSAKSRSNERGCTVVWKCSHEYTASCYPGTNATDDADDAG